MHDPHHLLNNHITGAIAEAERDSSDAISGQFVAENTLSSRNKSGQNVLFLG